MRRVEDVLDVAAHHPWPLPRAPWVLTMTWEDLLFAHWPVPADSLAPLIPKGLTLETFEGYAWLGIVPFRMTGVRWRFLPPIPGTAAFPELNVRTYVTAGGKPGVWFFSLDAASRLAVRGARWSFHLPYYDAEMETKRSAEEVEYRSRRTHAGAPAAEFKARYAPVGPVYASKEGTLEHFLTARYCLYAGGARGRLWRGEIHHPPWPLQRAEADIALNTMTAQLGLCLPEIPPLLHFARRLGVVAWPPGRISG
jgi:uncharacterized protein YqjF (DUF2071 family)